MEPASFEEWAKWLAPLRLLPYSADQVFSARDPREVADRLTLFYESAGNLKKDLKRYAGFEPNSRQASDIAPCLRQGREFLRIFRSAELMTQPIILYYGMACYARALALSFGNPPALDQFPARHGLKAPTVFGTAMENLEVRADSTDGLFHRFVSALSEVSGVAADTRDGHRFWIPLGTSTSADIGSFSSRLKSLLARTLGMEDLFRATFDELPMNAPVEMKMTHFGPADAHPQAGATGCRAGSSRSAAGAWRRHS